MIHADRITKPCVLVVEDHDDSREMLVALVNSLGYDTLPAVNAEEVSRITTTWQFALIDLGLPNVDGCELARRLRSAETEQHRCLVAVTGYSDPHMRRSAREAGFDHFCVKPVFAEELAKLLRSQAFR